MSLNSWGGNAEPIDEKKLLERRIAGTDLSDRADALEEMADYLEVNEPEADRGPYLMAAIDLNLQLGRERTVAELCISLGDYEMSRKHQGEALEAYLQGVEVGKAGFLESPTVRAMLDVARVYRDRNDYANALIWLNSAYELAIESNLKGLAANAKAMESRVLQMQGEYRIAYASAVEAHNLVCENSDGAIAAIDTLTNQAWIGVFAPNLKVDVDELLDEADALAEQVFQPHTAEFITILRLLSRIAKGQPDASVEAGLQSLLNDTRQRNDATASSVVHFGLAWYAAATGSHELALSRLHKFMIVDDYLDSRVDRRVVLRLQAASEEALGRGHDAIATLKKLADFLAENGPDSQKFETYQEEMRLTEAFPPVVRGCFLTAGPSKPKEEQVLSVIVGDITKLEVDAVVNAAKTSLAGGGGVDGAIHAAAGSALVEACLPLAPCPVGEARVTPGFRLPAKYVVHAVGPVYRDGLSGEPQLLASAYRAALEAAAAVGARSIAFPGISTGIYGYPVELATKVAIAAIREYLAANSGSFDSVQLIWLTHEQAAAAEALLEQQS